MQARACGRAGDQSGRSRQLSRVRAATAAIPASSPAALRRRAANPPLPVWRGVSSKGICKGVSTPIPSPWNFKGRALPGRCPYQAARGLREGSAMPPCSVLSFWFQAARLQTGDANQTQGRRGLRPLHIKIPKRNPQPPISRRSGGTGGRYPPPVRCRWYAVLQCV